VRTLTPVQALAVEVRIVDLDTLPPDIGRAGNQVACRVERAPSGRLGEHRIAKGATMSKQRSCRRVSRILGVSLVACVYLSWPCETRAQSAANLPSPEEPLLADPGNWAADFNQSQIACFRGSMSACDSIWLSQRVLLDSWLGKYGRTCGGRADLRAIRRADLRCTEAFPGHD
jgi:hypothetical protein